MSFLCLSIFERGLRCLIVCVCPFFKFFSKMFNLFVFVFIHFSSSVCLKFELLIERAMCIFQL